MKQTYFLTLFLIDFSVQGAVLDNVGAKATGSQGHNNTMVSFYDRVYDIIKAKCLKNANQAKYDEFLAALALFLTRTELRPRIENSTKDEYYYDCMRQTINYKAIYLDTVIDKLMACLVPEEEYLQEFLADVHGNYFEPFCGFMQASTATEAAGNKAAKCHETFESHPEMSPSIVCHNSNKTSLFEANFSAETVMTKAKVCDDFLILRLCYVEMMSAHCPDLPELTHLKTYIFTNGIKACKRLKTDHD